MKKTYHVLKKHKHFKRVKDTGYNYSFYFSFEKSPNVRAEAMIGVPKEEKDSVVWRYSIFENGLLYASYNSINNDIRETDSWFQTLLVDMFETINHE